MNLYEETRKDLELHGYSFTDIRRIECGGKDIKMEEFTSVSKKLNYEPSDGMQTVDPTLKICGDDWELVRCFTEGTEYWDIRTKLNDHRECAVQ